MLKIAVTGGAGYVGLTTTVCLASKGHTVYCVDVNEERIRQLRSGKTVIYEESLEELAQQSLSKSTSIPSTNLTRPFHATIVLTNTLYVTWKSECDTSY